MIHAESENRIEKLPLVDAEGTSRDFDRIIEPVGTVRNGKWHPAEAG